MSTSMPDNSHEPVPDPGHPQSTQPALERLAQTLDDAVIALRAHYASERRWRTIRRIGLVAFLAVSSLLYVTWYVSILGFRLPSLSSGDHVAVVTVSGAIGRGQSANADVLVPLIDKACNAATTRALVIRIRSPGGDPTESARIGARVAACRDKGREVIAFIDGIGASGGYMIAVHADEIVADRYAYVGSIGAFINLWDASELAQAVGVQEHTYATHELKNPASLTRAPTDAGNAYLQRLANAIGEQFVQDVQARRGARLKVPIEQLYTGEVWIGQKALELGLIDKIADFDGELDSRWPRLRIRHYKPRQTLFGGTQIAHEVGAGLASGVLSAIEQKGAEIGGLPR